MPKETEHKSIFQRFIEAINEQNLDALNGLVHPHFVRHSRATAPLEIRSLEDFKAFLRKDREIFPDEHVDVLMTVVEGDKVAAYLALTGTQEGPIGSYPPSGRKVDVRFLTILRFESSKIAEMWVEWDNLNLLTQLGHVSPADL